MTDEQGFAERMNSLLTHVASTTLHEPLDWNATRIQGDIADAVAKLKSEDGQDILVFGSAELVHTLRRHRLIDELRLMVFPVVLGSGNRLYGELADVADLRLVDATTVGSGVVVLTYGMDRSSAGAG